MMNNFTIGQRVKSAPGLHWMPTQRFGVVIATAEHMPLEPLVPFAVRLD